MPVGPGSDRLQNFVLPRPEVIARNFVEISARDSNDPGAVRMRGRMDHVRRVGSRLSWPEAIAVGHFENRMVLAVRIDATPFRHLGDPASIGIDRPGRAVAVRLAGFAGRLHVG